MTEKELEKLFKSKLGNRQFAFNPANWEAMEAMLNSRAKPAGPYYWRAAAAILLFALGVGGVLWMSPQAVGENVAGSTKSVEELLAPPRDKSDMETGVVKERDAKEISEDSNENTGTGINPTPVSTTQKQTEKPAAYPNHSNAVVKEKTATHSFAAENLNNGLYLQSKSLAYQYDLATPQLSSHTSRTVNSFTPEALKKYIQPHSFFLQVTPVFSAVKNSDQVGLGWSAGVGYQKNFDNGVVLNAGIGYTSLSGVNITSSSDSVFYNFGKEEIRTEEVNEKLDYIEVPLGIGYQFNSKHMVELGGFAGYLVNVSQEVNKEISTFKADTEYQQYEKKGYQEDFYRWNVGVNFGYRYNLNPGLSVGLHYSLGLRDITKNSSGEYQNNHFTRSTRVIFRYSIL